MKKLGQYVCMKCAHAWQAPLGPVECPRCGHLYVEWIDYQEKTKKG